jgi:hypothetical protein
MTDAGLLAKHLEWAANTEAAWNHAFNVVNGDVFRWSWMWQRIADWFELTPATFPGEGVPLERQLADAGPIWAEISRKYRLAEPNLLVVASPWHTDADLGRPIEVVTDMSKSRKLGSSNIARPTKAFMNCSPNCARHGLSSDRNLIATLMTSLTCTSAEPKISATGSPSKCRRKLVCPRQVTHSPDGESCRAPWCPTIVC